MKKYSSKVFVVIVLIAGILMAKSEGRTLTEQSTQPAVVQAVAPPFIPFIFGKTGSATVVVEVTVDLEGKVDEAHIVEFSVFRDKAFEETAKKWVFAAAADGTQERRVRLTFVLHIMPKSTQWDELTTIFKTPYQVEVRHEVFDPPTNLDPNPTKPDELTSAHALRAF